MNIDFLAKVLIRAFCISIGFLAIWALLMGYLVPQWTPWIYDIHEGLFGVKKEQVEVLHYGLMGLFKMLAFLFFLIPWLAIRLAK